MSEQAQQGDPRLGLDTVQPIDSGALMAEVHAEVERRRRSGDYPPGLDDVPPFGDLALDDPLVAAAHRLESLSRIPGVTPVIEEVGPGSGPAPAGFVRRDAKRDLVDRGLIAARAAARRVVGPRLEAIIRQGADYLSASAHQARVVTARILEIERRIRALEERAGPS